MVYFPYDPKLYDTSMASDDEAIMGDSVEDDADYKLDPSAEAEYVGMVGTSSVANICNNGSIPSSSMNFVGGYKTITMTGSRGQDRASYNVGKKFHYSEIHHGPLDLTSGTSKCTLYEVQAFYHQRAWHKGAVGQWNDLVRKNKKGTLYKK